MPVLNEASAVREAIESARAAGADEILVVDGGSCDQTVELSRECGALVIEGGSGRGPQMNAGAARASGDVLLFLHADCRLPAGVVGEVLKALQNDCVTYGCLRQRIDATRVSFRLLSWGNAWRTKRLGWVYGDQAMFVRRDAFEAVGGFPGIPLMEDLAISKKLRKAYGPPVVLDGPVVVSARRWQKQGVLYCTLRNWAFVVLFHLGVAPERLARWYRNVR